MSFLRGRRDGATEALGEGRGSALPLLPGQVLPHLSAGPAQCARIPRRPIPSAPPGAGHRDGTSRRLSRGLTISRYGDRGEVREAPVTGNCAAGRRNLPAALGFQTLFRSWFGNGRHVAATYLRPQHRVSLPARCPRRAGAGHTAKTGELSRRPGVGTFRGRHLHSLLPCSGACQPLWAEQSHVGHAAVRGDPADAWGGL